MEYAARLTRAGLVFSWRLMQTLASARASRMEFPWHRPLSGMRGRWQGSRRKMDRQRAEVLVLWLITSASSHLQSQRPVSQPEKRLDSSA